MIEYIVPTNIDDRVIKKAARMLENGALVALPTDTSWSIVCSIKSPTAIKKLRQLSGERDERHFTLLCSNISQFVEACNLDNTRFRLIKRLSPGPYVFILSTLPGMEKLLDISRHEAGIRIPDNPIPISLIKTLGHPLYSITAKRSMTGVEWESFSDEEIDTELPPIPEDELFESGWEIEGINEVELILDSGEERERIFSTILDMCGDEIKLLRKGAGPWPV
ncbi:MAG: L-threonylcarbamoyladenylate synthase [Treponema sp.]|nr:L-threonylcarbamoyladenylate synthase [Treponema sp.]